MLFQNNASHIQKLFKSIDSFVIINFKLPNPKPISASNIHFLLRYYNSKVNFIQGPSTLEQQKSYLNISCQ